MNKTLKRELGKKIEEVIKNQAKEGFSVWLPDDLIKRMTKAAVNVFNQNVNTQLWLRSQGFLKDNL